MGEDEDRVEGGHGHHHGFTNVDELGEVTFAATEPDNPGDVLDEIARRAWVTGARLLAVRNEDVPTGAAIAGTLRYAPTA